MQECAFCQADGKGTRIDPHLGPVQKQLLRRESKSHVAQQARFLDDRRPGRSPRLPADRTAAVVALAIEAVKCIGAIFEVEREINGMAP